MTRLPAAHTTTLVEAIHPDAPIGAVTVVVRLLAANVVVRLRVANTVVDRPGIGDSATIGVLRVAVPEAVTGGVRGDRTVVRITVLEAGQIVRVSVAARC